MKHVNPKDLTASPESDTVRVLREARALVKYKGWCQKVAKVTCDGQTSYCTMGAMSAAAGKLLNRMYAPTVAYRALFEITSTNMIPEWNDAPERTLEEVLDAFDGAIVIVQRWESLG